VPQLLRLASLVHNQVHAITPAAAEAVLQALDGRMHTLEASFVGEPAYDDRSGRWKGYRKTKAGVAILPIVGELVARGGWIGASSGVTSYEGLRQVLKAVRDDADVRAVVLDIDSPGGMVTGMFETAALVKALADAKPVIAVSNPLAASAAYGLASQASSIIAVPDSAVGSIGVLYVHADRSMQVAMDGIRVSIIQAGDQKTAGSSLSPLSDAMRADIQGQINRIYGRFVDLVVAGRPNLTRQQVLDTQARVYSADDAVAAGLADDVGTFDDVVAAVEAKLGTGRLIMRTTKEQLVKLNMAAPAAADAGNPWAGMTAAELEDATQRLQAGIADLATAAAALPTATAPAPAPAPQPPAAPTPPEAETPEAAFARGQAEERARIKGILTHADAQGRQRQAQVLALGTSLSVEEATGVLSASPLETVAAGTASHLAARSEFYTAVAKAGGNPKVAHQGEPQSTGYQSNLKASMQKLTSNLKKETR
jgi:signal peptide peptidase SppA